MARIERLGKARDSVGELEKSPAANCSTNVPAAHRRCGQSGAAREATAMPHERWRNLRGKSFIRFLRPRKCFYRTFMRERAGAGPQRREKPECASLTQPAQILGRIQAFYRGGLRGVVPGRNDQAIAEAALGAKKFAGLAGQLDFFSEVHHIDAQVLRL